LLYLGSEPVTPKLSIAKGLGDTTIDVWWFDTSTNGVLPLMLCHLLCRHPDFDKVKVRIFSPYWRGKGPAFQRAQTADPATLMHVIEAMSLRETSLQREASLRRSSLVEESADQSPHDNHAEQQHKPSLRSMSTVGSLPADKYRSLDGLHEHSAWSSVTSELSRERSAEEHREHMLNFLQMSRIAVDDVALVPCDEKMNVHDAMRNAIREQYEQRHARTALIIADMPNEPETALAPGVANGPRALAQSLRKLCADLDAPVLLVQGSRSNQENSEHLLGAAIGASVGGPLPARSGDASIRTSLSTTGLPASQPRGESSFPQGVVSAPPEHSAPVQMGTLKAPGTGASLI